MEHRVFAVYDEKAEAYLPPFYSPTVAVATRNFAAAANQEDNTFNLFAADYTLFEIGKWDDNTAKYTECTSPINHGTALQHRARARTIAQETDAYLTTVTTGAHDDE